jgi:hypothetical protein
MGAFFNNHGGAFGFGPSGGLSQLANNGITLDPANKSSLITLSGGNLIATHTGATNRGAAFATLSFNSGLLYFEYTLTTYTSNSMSFGWVTSDFSTAEQVGLDAAATLNWGYLSNGRDYYNNTYVADDSYNAQGATAGCAIDLDGSRSATQGCIWYRNSAGAWIDGDPTTSTVSRRTGMAGQTLFPAISNYQQNNVCTVNFGDSAFVHGLPAGFLAVVNGTAA